MSRSNQTILLPTNLVIDPLYSNPADPHNFRINLNATSDTRSYNLKLPKVNIAGYLYNPGNGELRWTAPISTTIFKDDEFRIVDDSVPSRKIAFSAFNISNNATRTITMPDANVDLGIIDKFKNLTPFEITQLENIDLNTISNTQWGYLSAQNQNLITTSNVSFSTLIANGTIVGVSDKFAVGTASPTNQSQLWFTNSNDPDPDNALSIYAGLGPICRLGSAQGVGDALNIISEGFETYGTSAAGGQMTSTNFSLANMSPTGFSLQDTQVGITTQIFKASPLEVSWCIAGAADNIFNLTSSGLLLTVPVTTQNIRIASSAINYVELTANPVSSYTVPFPVDPVTKPSYMITDGSISSWVEDQAISTNVDLYYYTATDIISGGGTALKDAIALGGGGIDGAPKVYEISDALTYTGGIDLTNISYIVIRGAVNLGNISKPTIVTDLSNPRAFYIKYDALTTGYTTAVTIGNMNIDITGPGTVDQWGISILKQSDASPSDNIGTIGIKNVTISNTNYTTTGISRSGLTVLNEYTESGFWVSDLYMEKCVFRNLTAQNDTGSPCLMGIQNYIGKYNAFLYPDLSLYGVNLVNQYYWIRGSNVKEYYSYFSQGTYSSTTAAGRYLAKISQDNLYSSYGNICSIEFSSCSFSNNVESTTGAIILSHSPVGTPGAALAAITLSVKDCTFTDVKGAGVLFLSDLVAHGNLVTAIIEDNSFLRTACGIKKDSTFVSGFSSISIARNEYNKCLALDTGFSPYVQQAVAKDLMVYSSMYKYYNLVDYTTWTEASSAYFTTTATFALGDWYTVDLNAGLPAGGWDLGVSNRVTQNATTGALTVLEDGLYNISYSISVINTSATVSIWEAYCRIDAESLPVAAPTTSDQRYKLSPGLQLSTVASEITPLKGELLLNLRSNQTAQLAIRCVSGDVGPLSIIIQAARMDILKMSI